MRREDPLNYRKTHLSASWTAPCSRSDRNFPSPSLNGQKIGLLICYDIEFPEPARRLALAGADIILIPTALMEPYVQVASHVIPARAYENQVYLAYANHSGTDDGLRYIGLPDLRPGWRILAAAGKAEDTLYATIDPAHHAAVRRPTRCSPTAGRNLCAARRVHPLDQTITLSSKDNFLVEQ